MKVERKEYTTQKTVYVSNDGIEFANEAECKKYEDTAVSVMAAEIKKYIIRKNNEFDMLFMQYGGSEDYDVATLDIVDDEARIKINHFIKIANSSGKLIPEKYNGQKILIGCGYDGNHPYEDFCNYIYGTADEIISKFAKHLREQFEKDEKTA